MPTANDSLNNLAASSAAALCSRLCTHPLDTLKTRIQVSNTPQPLLPTFVSLAKSGGLYRGLPIALTLSVPGLSVYLSVYDLCKDTLSSTSRSFTPGYLRSILESSSAANHMLSGLVAEVASGLFWTPMEILKSKQQVENMFHPSVSSPTKGKTLAASTNLDSIPRPTSTWDLARMIYRQEGIPGFYRGYFITLGVFVPYSMLYFAIYEQLKDVAWRRIQTSQRRSNPSTTSIEANSPGDFHHPPSTKTLPFLTIVGCAAVACGVAAGVSNTVDVVKTRWQTSILQAKTEDISSTRRIAEHMFKQGGLMSFTRGMGARVMWMIPSVAISMSTFEWLKAYAFV